MARLIRRTAAAGTALAVTTALVALTGPAHADPLPPYSASASAGLIDATVLGVDQLGLSAGNISVADAAGTSGRSTSPRATATARNVGGTLLTAIPLGGLAEASQSAPPDNLAPATDTTVEPIDNPVLQLGISDASAHARWAGDEACYPATVANTRSSVRTVGADVLTLPLVGSLVSTGDAMVSHSTGLEAAGPLDTARTVTARASGTAVDVDLFGGAIGVSVADGATLVARATGRPGGASIDWDAPLVTVSAGGTTQTLPVDGSPLDFRAPSNPLLEVELRLGQADETVNANGTAASATASVLSLRLSLLPDLGGGIRVADVDLIPLEVRATAPAGGVTCPPVTDDGTDTDGDGLTDIQELTGSENPFNNQPTDPNNPDSDRDGLSDLDEVTGAKNDAYNNQPTNPNVADTDGDGLSDNQEVTGSENDAFNNAPTNPNRADTDGDGLSDGQETSGSENDAFNNEPTNPHRSDTDGDGLTDREEVTGSENDKFGNAPTNPNVADTDGGGVDDGEEIIAGTNPNDRSDDVRAEFALERVQGRDRYATSAEVADRFGPVEAAVLANGEPGSYADALSAAYASGANRMPILLTQRDSTPAPVLAQLRKSGVKRVFLMGGPAAISRAQQTELAKTFQVARLEGPNRFATNAAAIRAGGRSSSNIGIVATGMDFPDALAGGPLAYGDSMPLALTMPGDIPNDTVKALQEVGVSKVIVLGGTNAVSQAVVNELAAAKITLDRRISGANRADTSVKVADYAIEERNYSDRGITVASGEPRGTGADALTGGALAGRLDRPILVTTNAATPGASVLDFLRRRSDKLLRGLVFGGPNAVSNASETAMEQVVRTSRPQPTTP